MQNSLSERELQEKENLHARAEALRFQESLLTASGMAIMITCSDGKITTFNAAAERLLGYSASEVTGKFPARLFHDDDELLRRAEALAAGMPAEPPFNVFNLNLQSQTESTEWTFIRKDGSRFPGSLSVVPLRDEEENVKGYVGIVSDLSEQKSLREQIAQSEEKFSLLAENIPGTIYLCHNDEAYTVIFLNDNIEILTGHPAKDFLSGKRSFADFLHPDDADTVRNTINLNVAQRKSFQLRYRLRHASGKWRWVDEHGVGVYDGERLTMLEGFIQDVTEQKEAEDRLHQVAEENLRFFNNPVNLNAVADFQGNLQRISPSWTKMLGWTEDELKAKPVLDFVHPADVESTKEALRFISKARKVHTFENRFAQKDGTYRWLLWGSASDPATKMIYASAVDISARKQSEKNILDSKSDLESITLQLQEQNRRLDEFAHIISHNLRAPVNNIQALINLLDEKSEMHDYRLIFEKLKNVAKNLNETMNELMDTLKAKTQPHVERMEIRFKEVLDKVVQSLEGELIVAQAAVTFDFNDAPVIYYSKPYLESIFQNLLTNAIKYRSPHRTPMIHFKSAKTGSHLEVSVSDNGQGIDMERFGDRIFGLHKTFHDHQEARGVGLFLVKTQIEALGGTISVSSEVDKGTTFTIRFG